MAGTIRFARVLADGHVSQSEIYLEHGNSLSKVKQFALRIKNYTTAETREATAIIQSLCVSEASEGDYQSLRHFAHVYVRRVSDNELFDFMIPAPDISLFEAQPEGDQIVSEEKGEILAGWYSDLAGEEFSFDSGFLVGSSEEI
jgi:hypothetical protein